MGHYGGYTLDMFKNLLDAFTTVKGKFIMSSYPSEILKEYVKINNWYYEERESALPASKLKGKRKIEVLTSNFPLDIQGNNKGGQLSISL